MNLDLNGKHILITGGSKGIGLACAKLFVQEGARVSLLARDEAALNAARETLNALREHSVGSSMSVDLRQPGPTADAVSAI